MVRSHKLYEDHNSDNCDRYYKRGIIYKKDL